MPSVTFLALLNEGYKLDVYDMKRAITISNFSSLEKERQEDIISDLVLPDDVLSDILEGETTEEDIQILKDSLNGN